MNKFFFLFFLFISSITFAGNDYKDIEFIGMENFSVEKKDGKVLVGFDYVINNPNWFSAVIMPSSLQLIIAEQDCGWVHVEEKIKLKKKQSSINAFIIHGQLSL